MWRTLLARALRGIAVEAVKRYAPRAHAWLREKARGLAGRAADKAVDRIKKIDDAAVARYKAFFDKEQGQ